MKYLNEALNYLKNSDDKDTDSYFDLSCNTFATKRNALFSLAFKIHTFGLYEKILNNKEYSEYSKKLSNKILKQENQGSFNYFFKSKIKLLPDDLDDSALVYSALFLAKKSYKTEYFLKTKDLEVKQGGPYKTWHYDNQKWFEVDPIVNANFYYFSCLTGVNLPKLKKYLLENLDKEELLSKYYTSNLYYILYLSRAAYYSRDQELANQINQKIEKFDLNKLSWWEEFLLVLSKLYLGQSSFDKKMLKRIFARQKSDGSFQLFPLTLDYPVKDKVTYTTSYSFTTSLFAEFLILYKFNTEKDNSIEKFYKNVIEELESEILQNKILKESIPNLKLLKPTKPILLPFLLLKDLKSKKSISSSEISKIKIISKAGFYGWMAFTLLDDYIDEKKFNKNPIYITTLLRFQFQTLQKLGSKIDWNEFAVTELQYLNELKNYSLNQNSIKLSTKYITKRMHIFINILASIPNIFSLSEYKHSEVYELIESLMIMDQLNDDLRDWKEDRKNNILTLVTQKARKIKTDKMFFEKVIPQINKIITRSYNRAKSIALKNDFKNIDDLIEKSYIPARKIIFEQKDLQALNSIEI